MTKKNFKNRLLQKQKNIWYKDIDVNKIFVSKNEKYGKYNSFKYFIGHNDNDVIKPLYLELPQMTGYIKILMDIKIKTKIKIKIHNNNISKG